MLSTVRDSQQKLLSKGALVFIFYLCLVNHSRPLLLRLANHLAHIRESKTVLDSGLHTLDSGCFVSPFQLFVLPHSLIPQANISRILDNFQRKKFPGSWSPNSLAWAKHQKFETWPQISPALWRTENKYKLCHFLFHAHIFQATNLWLSGSYHQMAFGV